MRRTAKKPQETIAAAMQEITSRKILGNLILNDISFKETDYRSGYAIVPIEMSLRGTFSSLQNYFFGLEKINYLFTVDNIAFKVSDKHPGIIVADLASSLYIGSTRKVEAPGKKKVPVPGGGK